jgi:DnaJ-domain-containing protein 1
VQRLTSQTFPELNAHYTPQAIDAIDLLIGQMRDEMNGRPSTEDPYAVLGVIKGAPRKVIEAAYRAQANLHHPDRTGDGGTRMAQVNKAYEKIKQEWADVATI